MSDTTFIWKYLLLKLIGDDHPAVYIYCVGQNRSKKSAVGKLTEEIYEWIGPDVFPIQFVRGVCKQFLEFKYDQYKKGEIKVKEIY
jgi:hypothetical protein